jgi:hypothetical protein
LKEVSEETKKAEEQERSYLELMNKLNINEETRKIINEKIQELYKEVDFKVADRQRRLDEKLKDFELSLKGKKK